MKRTTIFYGSGALAALGLLFCAAIMWRPSFAPIPQPPVLDQALVHRGARVAAQGDCGVCHTSPNGKWLAGGLPLKTPFGTLYTTNITSDRETGIGTWSEDAFVRAMRKGVNRQGQFLYPAFPYIHYSQMSDQDLSALYAWLMNSDPVHAPAHPNEMMFPMGFRPLVSFWNLLFLRDSRLVDVPGRSAEWNRGRYLVEGPGHCSSCHTPMNLIGAEKGAARFAGSVIDGWETPALTGMAQREIPWTQDQLVNYLRGKSAAPHGAAAGPMLPVSESLAEVPEVDVRAIATYILDLPDESKTGPKISASCADSLSSTLSANAGERLYQSACSGCHAPESAMRQAGRPGLQTTSALTGDSPRNLVVTVLQGIPMPKQEVGPYMPGFAHMLDDHQIAEIAGYLRNQSCPSKPWTDLESTVSKLRLEGDAK